MKQRDLVLLPYPFTDQEGSKVRPAVIVSNENFNRRSQDFVLVPLTTVIKEDTFSLVIDQDDLESGKLLKKSRIRVDKIFTIRKNLIVMQIGRINEQTFGKIKNEIVKIF